MARTRFKVKEGLSVADDNSAGGYPLVPVGTVMAFAGSTAPEGWLMCDGSAVVRTTYANLWAVLGTTYGSGDGSTTFNLPDALGRSIVGAGSGSGLTARTLSTKSGSEAVTIGTSNLPPHTHGLNNHTHTLGGHTHTTSVNPPNTGSGDENNSHYHGANSGYHEHSYKIAATATAGTNRNILTSTGSGAFTGGINYAYAGSTDWQSINHTHNTDVGAFDATSGGPSTDSGGASGDTTNGGFANSGLSVMQPFLVLNYIIKY